MDDLRKDHDTQQYQKLLITDAVLKNAETELDGISVSHIDIENIQSVPDNTILLLNYNDIYRVGIKNYGNMYLTFPRSIFVVWDWDNQHPLGQAMILAAFSDFYCPAHFDFYAQLAEAGESVSAPVWWPALATAVARPVHPRASDIRAAMSDFGPQGPLCLGQPTQPGDARQDRVLHSSRRPRIVD